MKVVMPIKRKQEKIWKNDLNIIFIIIYLHKNKIFILKRWPQTLFIKPTLFRKKRLKRGFNSLKFIDSW